MPPVCRSIRSPSRSSDIAEHSMCQPGKPTPHGESQVISRAAPAFFHSAQSAWNRLPWPDVGRLEPVPRPQVLEPVAGQLAVPVVGLGVEVDGAVLADVRVAGVDQREISVIMLPIHSDARG
jgi:hypothetical protein